MLHLKLTTTQKILEEIVSQLDGNIKNNVLTIPSHLGKGQMVKKELSDGLFYMGSDICYFEDFIFDREINEDPALNYLTLNYSSQFIDPTQQHSSTHQPIQDSFLFFNRHFSFKSFVPAYSNFKQAQFFISYEKLNAIVNYYDLPKSIIPIIGNPAPWCYKYPFPLEIQRVLHQIYNYKTDTEFAKGYLINKAEELIMLTFEHILRDLSNNNKEVNFIHEADLKIIHEAEKILIESEDENTKIIDIANQLSVGIRKLQRLFKAYHGTDMTSYRKQVRMEQARQMILQQNLSITEVCYKIGYTSISHFSKIFKDYFGISPSSLLNK